MVKNKSVATFLVIALCVGGIFLINTFRPNPELLLKKRMAERSQGDPSAKLWITEYFDYQCPPCANAYRLLDAAIKKNPGKIYLQAKYFPLPVHKNSMKAAIHAECASRQPGKFWKLHEQLFEHQNEWAMDSYAELKFLQYAQAVGISLEPWDACTKDPEVEKLIQDEKAKGESLGVQITPSFFVNGKMIVGNIALTEELNKIETKDTTSS